MNDKDKLFLVFYVGLKSIRTEDRCAHLNEIVHHMDFDYTISQIYVPDYCSDEIRVECINPKLITEEEYNGVQEIIDKVHNLIEELKK
jgi:hypothetical protein